MMKKLQLGNGHLDYCACLGDFGGDITSNNLTHKQCITGYAQMNIMILGEGHQYLFTPDKELTITLKFESGEETEYKGNSNLPRGRRWEPSTGFQRHS
jgi:hypothetical protein